MGIEDLDEPIDGTFDGTDASFMAADRFSANGLKLKESKKTIAISARPVEPIVSIRDRGGPDC
jgi:hypothetical protein